MSDLLIRLLDVYGQPLDDMADVVVTSPQSNRTVSVTKNMPATSALRATGLTPLDVYEVRAFPVRHRPVSQFHRAPAGGSTDVAMVCPVDPERVRSVTFPPWPSLSPRARSVLQASELDHAPLGVRGKALYDALEPEPVAKAGLLNLLAKMGTTPLPDGTKVLDYVDSLYRVRGDRVFASVDLGLRDLVKTGVADQSFKPVPGGLHDAGPNFRLVDSYKSGETYGNLQLTFFSSLDPPLAYVADVDVDNSAGLQHAFDVIEHWATDGQTHPYDIHQILIHRQRLDPGYTLNT
jgi:hypothetical protein